MSIPSLAGTEAAGEHPQHTLQALIWEHCSVLFLFWSSLQISPSLPFRLLTCSPNSHPFFHSIRSQQGQGTEPEPRIEILGPALKWGCAERGCPVRSCSSIFPFFKFSGLKISAADALGMVIDCSMLQMTMRSQIISVCHSFQIYCSHCRDFCVGQKSLGGWRAGQASLSSLTRLITPQDASFSRKKRDLLFSIINPVTKGKVLRRFRWETMAKSRSDYGCDYFTIIFFLFATQLQPAVNQVQPRYSDKIKLLTNQNKNKWLKTIIECQNSERTAAQSPKCPCWPVSAPAWKGLQSQTSLSTLTSPAHLNSCRKVFLFLAP